MIQKDIRALEEEFGKEMAHNKGRRGSVRYEDQTTPLFYQELTSDEEELLREVLRTLGQFEGLDNFTWFDLLSKKLKLKEDQKGCPIISFGENDILQFSTNLLGRLFTAISRRKTIKIKYQPYGKDKKGYEVYPYQLRQFNHRWYLLATPVGDEVEPYKEDLICNFALDRMDQDFDYLEDIPYIDTPVDLEERFQEIVGVTLYEDKDVEEIYFAVSPKSTNFVRSKLIHRTQMEENGDVLQEYWEQYPQLKGWSVFTIECRPNPELYKRLSSFGGNLVVLKPSFIRDEMVKSVRAAAENYGIVNASAEDDKLNNDER